jgi:hypothetical protein
MKNLRVINDEINNGELNARLIRPVNAIINGVVYNLNQNNRELYRKVIDVLLADNINYMNVINKEMSCKMFQSDIIKNANGNEANQVLEASSIVLGAPVRLYILRGIRAYINNIVKVMDIIGGDYQVELEYFLDNQRSRNMANVNLKFDKSDIVIPILDDNRMIDLGFSNYDCMLVEDKNIRNIIGGLIGSRRNLNKSELGNIKAQIRNY